MTMPTEKAAEDRLLTSELLKLVQDITQRFGTKRKELLAAHASRRDQLRQGHVDRLPDTAHIRDAVWKVDPVPMELLERRTELIGGCTRQEIVQGMNCGAKSYVADLWNMSLCHPGDVLRAHRNLERAVDNLLQYVDEHGDRIRVNPASTTRLFFVPRPLYILESSVRSGGEPVPASFFDLAVYTSYNAVKLRVRQAGVYLYLRGVSGHLEARLWKTLFEYLEEHFRLPRGTFRATVIMDSLSAALEADEILFELVHHSAGLAIDPQAFAADHIALFSDTDRMVLPDRERIGLNEHFLRSVSLMTIAVCHKRQAHAIGAPAFNLPPDEKGKTGAGYLEMIADKEREAVDGHDGTLVGHPGLVNPAMMEFNKSMPKAHQMYYERPDTTTPADLVTRPEGPITTNGLLGAIRTVLAAMVLRDKGLAVVEEGGRTHDRSSVLLSTLLLWSWTQSKYGFVTDTGLEIHDELISFLIRKEGTKLFAKGDAAKKEAGARAVALLTACVHAKEVPHDLLG
jgi:malate synthase